MHFERIYEPIIAQASYLVGSETTRDAIVVDPTRDVERYIEAARAEDLTITHVAETHIHADFASGARALAARTGARLLLSAEGGDGWQYAYARGARATLLRDGDAFMVGDVRVGVLHTPGHTPEHLAFTITDTPRGPRPLGVLTGDFVFVGDVGRPDLLERATGQTGTMDDAARTLFRSLQRFKALPDYLQLWPGHGAGSACGKALGAVPQTTLGYERLFNWALGIEDEETFVRAVLEGQPEPPAYFAVMKRLNRDDASADATRTLPPVLDASRLDAALRAGLVIDARSTGAFADGHVPGTVNVPMSRAFATWVASLLPYGRPLHLVLERADTDSIAAATNALALVGVERVDGVFDGDAPAAWAALGGPRALATVPQTSVDEIAAEVTRDDLLVLDVRNGAEWSAGHLPGVPNVPLAGLVHEIAHVRALAGGRPIVVHCQGGTRSAIAASLLAAHGLEARNLAGGYEAWEEAGLPVERAEEAGAGVAR